tara:strand:- start:443 stop:664 length:222 start_codon:yes stop_codon:yes gene_type:complete
MTPRLARLVEQVSGPILEIMNAEIVLRGHILLLQGAIMIVYLVIVCMKKVELPGGRGKKLIWTVIIVGKVITF